MKKSAVISVLTCLYRKNKRHDGVKKSAFTLAEMMVVMLILSIVLAAFAPMMTKRRTVDNSSPWRYATNNSDAYYGLAAEQTAMIGQNAKRSDDLSSKLLINTSGSGQAHMALVSSGTKLGQLYMNGTSLILGGSTSKVITPGSYNTLLGYEAAGVGDTTGDGNTGVGYRALYSNMSGSDNTATGKQALYINVSGKNNTATGTGALYSNRSNNNNTATGSGALYSNTSGYNNTAIGPDALYSNTSGYYNTAIGSRALYSNTSGGYNTAIGSSALFGNTEGSSNIAIGERALAGSKIGDSNIAIGGEALQANDSGNKNIAIGTFALFSNDSGNNNIAIGYYACRSVKGSNKICIGAQSGPTSILEDENDSEAVYLGTSAATVYIPGNLVVNGTFTAPQSSDRRLKNIKGENKSGLAQVRELKVYDYTFKNDKEHKPQVGVIAQDLEKVFPNAVIKGDDGYLKIRRDDMFYAMVNAIKELDAKLTALVEEVKSVIARIDKRDEEIKALQDEVKSLQAENETLKKQNQDFEKRLKKLEKLF